MADATRDNNPIINIPNTLGVLRMMLALTLPAIAWQGWSLAFLIIFIIAQATDWIDGRIARHWNQRTRIGPVIDSIADAMLYSSLALGVMLLQPETMRSLWPWIAAVFGAYAINVAACALRFSRMPAYHTRLAKIGWLVVTIAALVLILEGPAWPAQLACALLIITNLEQLAITATLHHPRTDVSSWLTLPRNPQPNDDPPKHPE